MMAASAVLTLIYFKLSVKSFLNLARGLRERAESVHVTCGPFLSVISLREPETGPNNICSSCCYARAVVGRIVSDARRLATQCPTSNSSSTSFFSRSGFAA